MDYVTPLSQDILEEEEMNLEWDFKCSLINDIVKEVKSLQRLCMPFQKLRIGVDNYEH